MNITLTNITNDTSNNTTHLDGYQEIKLISFYHDREGYDIVGPIPITREVEVALLLWIPTLDPKAWKNSDFTKVWIKEPLMIRLACELWRQFRAKKAALVQQDAAQALESAANPMEHTLCKFNQTAPFTRVQ